MVPRSSAELEGVRTVKLQVQDQEETLKHLLDSCFAVCSAGQQQQGGVTVRLVCHMCRAQHLHTTTLQGYVLDHHKQEVKCP